MCLRVLFERTFNCNTKYRKDCTKNHKHSTFKIIETIKSNFGGFLFINNWQKLTLVLSQNSALLCNFIPCMH